MIIAEWSTVLIVIETIIIIAMGALIWVLLSENEK